MAKTIVTISRQFGALGRSIAHRLSEMLGIEYLDRDIVEATSRRMGLPVSMISAEEENSRAKLFMRAYPLGVGIPSIKDEIFEVQKQIILDFAAKGSCIIVGRCADYILKDEPGLLSVYIYAPLEKRVRNCVEVLGMDEKTARRMTREVDTARENYHRFYIPGYVSPFYHRSICLDSGSFGVEGCAALLAEIVNNREKYGKANAPQLLDLIQTVHQGIPVKI